MQTFWCRIHFMNVFLQNAANCPSLQCAKNHIQRAKKTIDFACPASTA